MEADYKHLLRLLKIEAYELPFTFVNEKPVIDEGYYALADSLSWMREAILTAFPRLSGSLDFGPAKKYSMRFLYGLWVTLSEHEQKMKEAENYKRWKRRKRRNQKGQGNREDQ